MQKRPVHWQITLGLVGSSLFAPMLLGSHLAVALPGHNILVSQKTNLASQYINRALDKLRQHDWQGAIADATQAIQLGAKSADAYAVRALARSKLKDYQRAIADATQAIRLDPKNPFGYISRAIARNHLNDSQGAIADATQAIRLNPKFALSYRTRADARIELGDYQGAIADATQTLQIEPQNTLAYGIRAAAYLGSKNFQNAITDATRAIQLNSKFTDVYIIRADARIELGDYQGAIADATQAIQINPQSTLAYNTRAKAYLRLREYQQALADANQAIALTPRIARSFHNRGIARLGLGDYQGAIKDLDQTIALEPVTPKTFYYRGLARFRLGNNPGAIADYNQAIKLDPKLANDDTLDHFNNPQLANYAALARSGGKANAVASGVGTAPVTSSKSQTTAPSSAPQAISTAPVPEPAQTSQENVYQAASQFTVLISGQNPGSGVIFAKTGNTYYVLTAKHVVATPDEYEIIDADKKRHPLDYSKVKKLPNIDLAVVQFTSNQAYRVARLGNSQQVQEGNGVFVAGWPVPNAAITQPTRVVTKGEIAGLQTGGADGYELLYSNTTSPGMSGGPVLNARGELIGIHGRADGTQERGKTGLNLGIPINLFLQLAPQTGLNLQQLGLRAEK
jgi:tetratricopeptide (TPR) repeat protein